MPSWYKLCPSVRKPRASTRGGKGVLLIRWYVYGVSFRVPISKRTTCTRHVLIVLDNPQMYCTYILHLLSYIYMIHVYCHLGSGTSEGRRIAEYFYNWLPTIFKNMKIILCMTVCSFLFLSGSVYFVCTLLLASTACFPLD